MSRPGKTVAQSVYATIVELPGERLVMLCPSEADEAERVQILFNVAHVVSTRIAECFAGADGAAAREFVKVGNAAANLQRTLEAFQKAARAAITERAS